MDEADPFSIATRFLADVAAQEWHAVLDAIHASTVTALREEGLAEIVSRLELKRFTQAGPGMVGFSMSGADLPRFLEHHSIESISLVPGTLTVGALAAMPARDFVALFLQACATARPRRLLGLVPLNADAQYAVWVTDDPDDEVPLADRLAGVHPSPRPLPHPDFLGLWRRDGRWWVTPDRWLLMLPLNWPEGLLDRGTDNG